MLVDEFADVSTVVSKVLWEPRELSFLACPEFQQSVWTLGESTVGRSENLKASRKLGRMFCAASGREGLSRLRLTRRKEGLHERGSLQGQAGTMAPGWAATFPRLGIYGWRMKESFLRR